MKGGKRPVRNFSKEPPSDSKITSLTHILAGIVHIGVWESLFVSKPGHTGELNPSGTDNFIMP